MLLIASSASAQDEMEQLQPERPAQYGEMPIHASRVTDRYESDRVKFRDDANILVLPGLIADRKSCRVELTAEATGIASQTIVEFLLIAADSDKGYEALLWSHAKPSDVHRALEFIGMKPGEPFHPGKLRFWPKGERVIASVAAEGDSAPVRLESLVIDKSTERTLPETGFVFTGSMTVTSAGDSTRQEYAADVMDPKSVASLYNDPTTVLDIPRRARKAAVYGSQLVGPDGGLRKNELVTITLEPESKKRVVDLVLDIRMKKPTEENPSSPQVEFLLTDTSGKPVVDETELPAVLAYFSKLVEADRDPFVSIRFDPALPLTALTQVCKFLAMIDTERGIRIEPPESGQLYYEAFLPNRRLLQPESRVVDPWELHLKHDGDTVKAVLELHKSAMVDGKIVVKETSHQVDSLEALRRRLDEDAARRKAEGRRPGPPVLLVFVNTRFTYGQLADYLTPVMTTHNVIHVFIEPAK